MAGRTPVSLAACSSRKAITPNHWLLSRNILVLQTFFLRNHMFKQQKHPAISESDPKKMDSEVSDRHIIEITILSPYVITSVDLLEFGERYQKMRFNFIETDSV